MTKLKDNHKHIIYLDQYCTSNMFDDDNDTVWQEIKTLLLNAYSESKIICPIPYEHFLETAPKGFESGVNTINNFKKISGGYISRPELIVTTQLMVSYLRKNNLTMNTYFTKDSKIVFTDPENYEHTRQFKQGYKENFITLLEDVNTIRQASRTFKSTEEFDKTVYTGIKKKYEMEFLERLKNTFKAGHMTIRADQFGYQQVPNWIDAIIYRLLAVHKISTRETQRLIQHIELRGFSDFPQLDIKKSLIALNAIQHKKEQESDHFDFTRLATGLPYSDLLFTDKRRKAELVLLGLDKKYNCKVFTGTVQDLSEFIQLIKSL